MDDEEYKEDLNNFLGYDRAARMFDAIERGSYYIQDCCWGLIGHAREYCENEAKKLRDKAIKKNKLGWGRWFPNRYLV